MTANLNMRQDISDPATSNKIVEVALTLSPRIDCLISNAGICIFDNFLTMPLENYKKTSVRSFSLSSYLVTNPLPPYRSHPGKLSIWVRAAWELALLTCLLSC